MTQRESDIQRDLVKWFRAQYPQYAMALRTSQSEGSKGDGKKAAIRWSKILALGGVKGESDIAIMLPRGRFGSLLIELKTDYGRASESQLAYINFHNDHGNCAMVVKGFDAAKAAIETYMGLGDYLGVGK